MTRKTATLTIVTLRVVEETDGNHPSLPPFPVDIETTGETVSEAAIRPLAKVLPLRVARKAVG